MGLIWLALGAITLWALVRLGHQTERPGRGHWRVTATFVGAAMLGGGALALSRGAWIAGLGLIGGGLWLALTSRIRTLVRPRGEGLSEGEARRILGVGPDASQADIHAAWRRMIARAHPDHGGSQGLAERVNAARDRLKR